jgi:hypothetical protein
VGISNQESNPSCIFYASDDQIFIKGDVMNNDGRVYVYNVMGQCVCQRDYQGGNLLNIKVNAPSGYYLVKVVSGAAVHAGKVFLK